MCGGEGKKERGVHRVSGLVGPAECSPYYGTLSPSLSLPHSFRSSFLPSFPPCPLSFSTYPPLSDIPCLCLVFLSSLPVQIVYNSGFAIRLLCRSRATGFSLFRTLCINVCTSKIVRVELYIYIYTRKSCTRMYIWCFSFFARLYNDTTACQCPRD